MAFLPLFCQSHHSPRGVAPPQDLVRRARALGYGTLGLCDEATIAGFHDFDDACREQGIRPVFGCRIPVAGIAVATESFPIDFLIETEQGYRNLVRLLTRYHHKGEAQRRPLQPDDLASQSQGLIVVIPPEGELAALLQLRNRVKTEVFLERVVAACGAGLVFGVAPPTPETIETARLMLRLSRFIHVGIAAAPPVRYPEAGDAAAAVFLEQPLQAPGRTHLPPKDIKTLPALWPEDEVLAAWTGELEELPHETANLARRCTWRPGKIRRVFPSLDLERGFDPNSYLFDLAIRGATQRYGEITEKLKKEIHREFEDLRASNMSSYMLLCHQIAQALDDRGISRGVGRGWLIASVIAYCLGISRIDPLEYNLKAKSLASEAESSPPIFVEIPRTGVTALLEWLRETFGAEHIAEIGRLQEVSRVQMINELAAWAGMTDEERRLVHREKARLRSTGAAARLSELAEGTRTRRWRDPAFLGDIVARLAPRPRQWMGTGDRFVLSGEPLDGVVPRVQAQQGRPVTGLEEEAIDRLGLARIILTPHQLLDILDQAMQSARALNPTLDFRQVPLNDRATFELLGRGHTSGIPPLEGVTLRCLLRRHKPTNIIQLWSIKGEANAGRPSERPRDLSEELPDVLLSYQCAYLKANFPLAFYGAAIGAVIDQRGNPAALVREARRAGYEVQPPDVNLSEWGASVHSGGIRLGLGAIRNFGRRAWENVFSVRSGGTFTSLESFCEQVDARVLNVRLLRSMVAAGALDSLDQSRAAMDALVGRLQRRVRGRETTAEAEAQGTLFDLDELEEDDHLPPAGVASASGAVPEWNVWERLQRETEALGFSLGVDPIRRFKIPLEHLEPLHIEQVTARLIGKTLRVVGLVGGSDDAGPLINTPGDLLVDLEGLPVYIPAPLAEVSGYCLEPVTEVLVIGELKREEGYLFLAAEGIWRLADIEEQGTKVGAIELDLSGENRSTLKMLRHLVSGYPGGAAIRLANYPGSPGWTYRGLSRQRVFFCSPLYQGLCKILPQRAVTLYGMNGDPLLVKTPRLEDGEEAAEIPVESS